MEYKFILLFLFLNCVLQAQVALNNLTLNNRGRFPSVAPSNTSIRQSSGLALHPNTNTFWTHNDQGLPISKIYRFEPMPANSNADVTILDSVTINAANIDWEEMTKDNAGNLYIMQTGKNCNATSTPDCATRYIFQIHQMPFASLTNGATVTPTTYYYKYPKTGYDVNNCLLSDTVFANCEAAIWYNNAVYVFIKDIWSKNTIGCGGWSGDYSYLFKIPLQAGSSAVSPITAQYLGKLNTRINAADTYNDIHFTGAAISPDNSTIALSTYTRIWFLKGFTTDNFFSALQIYYASLSDQLGVPLTTTRAYEGIEFKTNDTVFLSVDNLNGRVSSFSLSSTAPLETYLFPLSFKATPFNAFQNQINYSYSNDENIDSIILQTSTDLINWETFNTIKNEKSIEPIINISAFHNFKLNNKNYYKCIAYKKNNDSLCSMIYLVNNISENDFLINVDKNNSQLIIINNTNEINCSSNIFNINGQLLASNKIKNGVNKLDMPQNSMGIYFVQIITENKKYNYKIQF